MAHTHWAIVRLYVAGELVDTATLSLARDVGDVLAQLGSEHAEKAAKAESEGLVYLVEWEFDDGEFVRWGTDRAGMVWPLEVGMGNLIDYIEKRFDPGKAM